LTRLSTEADGLWSPGRRAKHRKFSIAEDKLNDAQRELREHTLSAAKWRELKKAYEDAEEAYGRIDQTIRETTVNRNRLSRIRRVFRDIRRKQELDRLLAELGDVIALPEDADRLVAETIRADAEAAARASTLKGQLLRAEEALEGLTFDETIIQRAADVRHACERRIEIRSERADLPKREAELHAAEGQLKTDAAELGWQDDDEARLIEQIPPRPKVSVARSLLNQKRELEGDVSGKAILLEEAEEERAGLKEKLAEAGEPADPSNLALSLKSVREQGDISGRVRAAEEGLKNAGNRITRRLGELTPSISDEAALTAIRVPARTSVQAERDAQDDWQRRLKEAQQQAISVQQELDGATAALERTLHDEQVVTAEELKDARHRRDAVWQLVKLKHVDGQAIPTDLAKQYERELHDPASAFEPALVRADELADRRFDHAEAAGRIAEIRRKIGEHETRLGQVQDNERTLAREGEQLKAAWGALWNGASFEPAAPGIMLEWLQDRDEVLAAIEARDEAVSALEAAQGEEQAARQRLTGELAALGVDTGALKTDGLTMLVERVANEVRIREAAAARKALLEQSVADAGKLATRRRLDLDRAQSALAEWQEKWARALRDLGLDADTPAEAVDAQISIIDQMRETASRINSLRHDRIGKIERDIADFETVVSQLVQSVAPDLAGQTADDAVAAMETQLSTAERIREQRERQDETVEDLKEQTRLLEGERRELEAGILHLKQTSGADGIDTLKAAIERSDTQRTIQSERSTIMDKLQEDGDGKSVEELEDECEGVTLDDVAAREASLDGELDDLRIQQAAAGEERSEARQAYQAIGGDDAASQAAAAKEEALAEINEAAEKYVRVKTSAILLQWAIDRYRREKQAPLLKRAEALFQIMTGGSFASLRVDYDDQDKASLAGVRPDESVVPVTGMSTGTADQLYLALRVASIDDYLERAEALPFIADDLFINFDDDRAAAGFQLLGQMAEKTQVLFFTHHHHLVDIAKVTLGMSVNCVYLNEQAAMMTS